MSAEDLQRSIDLPAVRGERLPRGRALSRGELRALFESCRKGRPADRRDAALMGVLYGAGLRRAEVVALKLSDYDPETGALIVRGKGNKERTAYIDDGAAEAMEHVDYGTRRGARPVVLPDYSAGRGNHPPDYGPSGLLHPPDSGRSRRRYDRSLPTIYAGRACRTSSMPGSTSLWCNSSSVMPTSPRPLVMTAEVSTPRRGRPSLCTSRSWSTSNSEGADPPCHRWSFRS